MIRIENKSRVLFPLLLMVLLFAQCKKEDQNNDKPNTGQGKKNYTGTAITVIRYYEFNPNTGQDEFIEEKNYNYPVLVFTDKALSKDGISESNPFNLQIYPDRTGNPDEEGHLDISSAIFVTGSYGEVLLQYWNLNLNNGLLTGTLTETHLAEAAASNLLWAWDDVAGIIMTMPFPVAVGATIDGTLTENQININITGESVNTYRKFTCSIQATLQK